MPTIVFVAPFLKENALTFTHALASLPGVDLCLITHEPLSRVPMAIRGLLKGHFKITNAFDAAQVAEGTAHFMRRFGGVDQLLSIHEELQIPVAEARDRLDLPGMGAEATNNFRDKSRMKSILRAHDLPCARHCLVYDADVARRFAKEVGFPLVGKPPAGLGTRNTYRIENETQLEAYLQDARPTSRDPALLEEFMLGQEHSFESFCLEGKTIWTSLTRYFPTPLEAMENPWIQWCLVLPREVDSPEFDDIRAVAARANKVLGMGTGLSHMEWFRRRDGSVAISEVGSRPPGVQIMRLLSYANDQDFFKVWARFMVLQDFEAPVRKYAAGCAFLRGQGEGHVKKIHGLDRVAKELGNLICHTQLPKIGQGKGRGYEGEGFIILRHPDTEMVKRGLKLLISNVRVEMG